MNEIKIDYDVDEFNEENIIKEAQNGSKRAFECLVKRYDHFVVSLAHSYVRNDEDVKDIYQEVFMRVYKSLSGFNFESKFSTWLYRITANVCLTHRSRRQLQHHAFLDTVVEQENSPEAMTDHYSPDKRLMDSEIPKHVQKAMNILSPNQRMVFLLRFIKGYKIREIGEVMNISEGTVKNYLFTATERMRDKLRYLL